MKVTEAKLDTTLTWLTATVKLMLTLFNVTRVPHAGYVLSLAAEGMSDLVLVCFIVKGLLKWLISKLQVEFSVSIPMLVVANGVCAFPFRNVQLSVYNVMRCSLNVHGLTQHYTLRYRE